MQLINSVLKHAVDKFNKTACLTVDKFNKTVCLTVDKFCVKTCSWYMFVLKYAVDNFLC